MSATCAFLPAAVRPYVLPLPRFVCPKFPCLRFPIGSLHVSLVFGCRWVVLLHVGSGCLPVVVPIDAYALVHMHTAALLFSRVAAPHCRFAAILAWVCPSR